jgi:hypothetical protein
MGEEDTLSPMTEQDSRRRQLDGDVAELEGLRRGFDRTTPAAPPPWSAGRWAIAPAQAAALAANAAALDQHRLVRWQILGHERVAVHVGDPAAIGELHPTAQEASAPCDSDS